MTARSLSGVRSTAVVRTCIGCRERADKSVLLRLVAAGNEVVPDPRARLAGRGAYVHPSRSCFELAQRRRAFPRALRVPGPLGVAQLAGYLAGRAGFSGQASNDGQTATSGESGSRRR